MLSLYFHIPFCNKKCSYCNFFVIPLNEISEESFQSKYSKSIISQLEVYSNKIGNENIKTIYFGGGTPLLLGKENIHSIIDKVIELFNLEYLEEISFELNPDPYDEVIDFVNSTNEKYKKFFRIRYSFGIQSLDDDVLKSTNRNYIYNTLVGFLRDLVKIKASNNVFNFDFISFGKFFDYDKKLILPKYKLDFLNTFLSSGFADSISIYTLELFPGSFMFDNFVPNDDLIYEEFDIFKKLLFNAGYKRYEISNFELSGKRSLHNMVYWQMGEYIGFGTGASSFLYKNNSEKILNTTLSDEIVGVRFENTKSWKDFFSNDFSKFKNIQEIDNNLYLKEEFFLALRTSNGINDISKYKDILVGNHIDLIEDYIDKKLLKIKGDNGIKFTSSGLDIYNHIITELLE